MIFEPPRVATWLVNLFTTGEEAESMLGDLQEEYSHLALRFGIPYARRWYWWHTGETVAHLFGSGFRDAPWSTTAVVVAGFLLLNFVTGLPDKLLSGVTDRYLMFWSTHFKAYIWVLNGLPIAHLTAVAFVGCVVALVAKGREMVPTITLALVLCGLSGTALAWVGTHRPIDVAWMLWLCADPLALVLGGVIVRTRRSGSTKYSSC